MHCKKDAHQKVIVKYTADLALLVPEEDLLKHLKMIAFEDDYL